MKTEHKTKYRIVERPNQNGSVSYIAQLRIFASWLDVPGGPHATLCSARAALDDVMREHGEKDRVVFEA